MVCIDNMYIYIYVEKSCDCNTGTGRMPSKDWMCHFCCSDDGIPSTFVCGLNERAK